jgi:hypothetical protein
MKPSLLLLSILIVSLTSYAQTKTYVAENWADVEKYHDVPTAMGNSITEKVSVELSPKTIKATFGSKVKVYQIVSKRPVNEMATIYKTTRDNKTCLIIITDWNNIYSLACNGEWSVWDVKSAYTSK